MVTSEISNQIINLKGVERMNCIEKEMTKHKRLSRKEEKELATRVQNGDNSAIDRLVEANLLLVAKIAQDYKNMNVSMEDLISVGSIGLVNAVKRYQPDRGAKLSTFAKDSIRHEMCDFLSKMLHAVSMSIGKWSRSRKARKIMQEVGNGSCEQVAKKLGLKKKTNIMATLQGGGTRVSLDDFVDGDNKRTYLDVIEDDNDVDAIAELRHEEQLQVMLDSMDCLTSEERHVIVNRFGLSGEKKKTLREIGHDLGKTTERIRQIEEGAKTKLQMAIASKIDVN